MSNTKDFSYAGVNPCAEEPLPAGGSCLLGSINLSEFVVNPFSDTTFFDFDAFKKYDCVGKGNCKSQQPVTGETSDQVIFFACSQMHQFRKIIEYNQKRRHNSKQPRIISVA